MSGQVYQLNLSHGQLGQEPRKRLKHRVVLREAVQKRNWCAKGGPLRVPAGWVDCLCRQWGRRRACGHGQ